MKLGIYLDYDQFYPVNSVVCSLKSYFDHFRGADFVSKNPQFSTLTSAADVRGRMISSTIIAVSDYLLQSSRKPSGPKTEATKIGWGLVKN